MVFGVFFVFLKDGVWGRPHWSKDLKAAIYIWGCSDQAEGTASVEALRWGCDCFQETVKEASVSGAG